MMAEPLIQNLNRNGRQLRKRSEMFVPSSEQEKRNVNVFSRQLSTRQEFSQILSC